MTRRKAFASIAAALLLGGLFYIGVWPFIVGGRNMQAFCASLAKDTPAAQVRDTVQRKRYRMTAPNKDGSALIHDPSSFGRFICEVRFKDERLLAARYLQKD